MRWPRVALTLLAIATVRAEAGSPPALLVEKAKLSGSADEPADSTSYDHYGASVALEGDVLVVGAPFDDVLGTGDAGAVYVYQRTGATWTLHQKLRAPIPAFADRFGFAVALSGDTLVVGAPNPFYEGAVYIFVKVAGVWQQHYRFISGDGFEDNFGAAVALSGNTLVAGAPNADHTFGAAYVFVRTGSRWSRRQKLVADFLPAFVVFLGASVAIADETIAVGAPSAGAVVLFRRIAGRWTEVDRLAPGDGTEGDGFGRALAASNDTLVVGASPAAPADDGVGAAYVFVRNGSGWVEQQKLVDPVPGSTRGLGSAVAVLGDRALVGTRKFQAPRGSALLFDRSGATWVLSQRIRASDGLKGDAFGAAVALSNEDAVVGAPGANISGNFRAGAAYVLGPPSRE